MSSGRLGVDLLEDALPEALGILMNHRSAGPEIVSQAHQPLALETHSPFADSGRSRPHHGCDLQVAFAARRFQDDSGPLGEAPLGARGADELFKLGFFGGGEVDRGAWTAHQPQNSSFAYF